MPDGTVDAGLANTGYDVERIRADFPILSREVYGKPLTYLDNAASAQKPRQVIEAMQRIKHTFDPSNTANPGKILTQTQ